MKHWIYIALLIFISCSNNQQQIIRTQPAITAAVKDTTNTKPQSNNDICWTGTVNNKTPVFIHYQQDSNVIIGEIIYLNTKDKLPITLLGTIQEDKNYRLLEFEKSGNITGIIEGLPAGKIFKGTWFSPKTRKELALNLAKKDTVITPRTINTSLENIFGDYHYQYGEVGYQGDLGIKKLPDAKASFGITSVTNDPARNVAQIDDDTITLNTTQFDYALRDAKDCAFRVKLYKGFAYIKYTNGFCIGQFGNNATVEGIFLKTK